MITFYNGKNDGKNLLDELADNMRKGFCLN